MVVAVAPCQTMHSVGDGRMRNMHKCCQEDNVAPEDSHGIDTIQKFVGHALGIDAFGLWLLPFAKETTNQS